MGIFTDTHQRQMGQTLVRVPDEVATMLLDGLRDLTSSLLLRNSEA